MNKKTTLLAYFDLNKEDKIGANGLKARNLLYCQIPQHFTLNAKTGVFTQRKAYYNTIGRMPTVTPAQTNVFHIRILLSNVKGATCFEDLRKYENTTYTTYQEACLARGLIQDNTEWIRCIEEAITYQQPYQLRALLSLILIHCNPTQPLNLWEQFKNDFSEDYLRDFTEDLAYNKALEQIEKFLNDQNTTLTAKGLPGIEIIEDIEEQIIQPVEH